MIHPVLDLDAVGVMAETGEACIKGLQRFQIADQRTVRGAGILARIISGMPGG